MKKTDKTPRERLSIKSPKVKKGPFTAETEWYDKAYQRFSIVLRRLQSDIFSSKTKIN